MQKINLKYIFSGLLLSLLIASCANKLDLAPVNDVTPEKAYSTAAGYKSVLEKRYATLSISGNTGPAGSS